MEIIAAAALLPMTAGSPIVKDGAIAVEAGKIAATGTITELSARYPNVSVQRFPDDVLLPGLVNAHCHLDMIDFDERTFVDRDFGQPPPEFTAQLVAAIDYKQETKPDCIAAAMKRGADRLIETGTTTVGCVTHFEGAFGVLADAGLCAVIFPEVVAGRAEAAQTRFEVALALVEKYNDAANDRLRVGLAPAAPYLLSRNLLKVISRHARDATVPLQIHAAESFAEMEFFFDSQGPIATELFPNMGWSELPPPQRKTPIQYLADIGFFEAAVTIVGGLHLSARDLPLLARYLTRVVYCPTTNRAMKHGTLPLGKLTEAGIPVGFGTDLWNTRLGFSLWDEMRLAIEWGSTPLPTAREALTLATIGSARCLGLDHLIGTLAVGKRADYILVRKPSFRDDSECFMRLVAETGPQHVRRVVVGEAILKST